MFLPKVSFVMPVLNEESRIARSLESIRTQLYPQEKIEIVLADGGSIDKTIEIAKQFDAKVFLNSLKLAEPGVHLATQKATGDFCVVMAADNVLPKTNWLTLMVEPFVDDKEIVAVFTKIIPAYDDTLFSQYIALMHADPFNEFIYGKAANPEFFSKIYPIIRKGENYTVYDFAIDNFPLIAMAQGFTFRKKIFKERKDIYDDMTPILDLIKQKKKIAYVPDTGIYHYSFYSFADFLHKYNKRIKNAMQHSFVKRELYLSRPRKIRQYIWILYSLSIVLPFITAVINIIKKKQKAHIFHPIACFSLTVLIIKNVVFSKLKL